MTNYCKSIFLGLLCIFALLVSSSVFAAQQSGGQTIGVTVDNSLVVVPPTPVIIQSQDITTNTVDLVVEVGSGFSNESLNFFVTMKNIVTGDITNANYTQNTNINARTTISVSGLDPGTEYEFTVRYARPAGVYSADSAPHNATTLIAAPVLDSIDAITTNSADLHVIIDPAFIGSTMDFIIEVNDGNNTYTVQMTRNITGIHVILPMNNLDADTGYTFKVKYARANTLNYSSYSNEKSIVTESDVVSLDKPTITDIRNITTTSMEVVVDINGHDNDDLDFVLHIINRATGSTFTVNYSETVDNNGVVILGVGGLDPGTEYEFKVKYAVKNDSDYSGYSSVESAYTKYLDEENIEICYNGSTILVSQDDLQSYLDQGAIRGSCEDDPNQKIEICHKGRKTLRLPQAAIQAHLNHGDTLGPCKTDMVSGGSVDIDEDVNLTQKDKVREMILPEEEKEKYVVASVIGAAAATTAALMAAAIPLFASMPGALGTTIFLKVIELFGIVGRRKEEKNWGVVFDGDTRMPIPAVKIILLDKMGKEMATTYSDKDGRFGFLVNSGTYVMNVFKKNYDLITRVTSDELYGNVYDGSDIQIDEEHMIVTNIAMHTENVDWTEFANKRKSQIKLITIMSYVFGALYFIGFGATMLITYFYPSVFNFIVLGIYIILFMYRLFAKKKRYGSIETTEGNPVPFAVVNLYDKNTSAKQGFAVTDSIGRYYLLANNGKYKLKAKGQPVSGMQFEKQGNIHVKDGIVRRDIVV